MKKIYLCDFKVNDLSWWYISVPSMMLIALVVLSLVFGCTKQPWLTQTRDGWTHASDKYHNYTQDKFECDYLELAKPTQKSIIKPLRMGSDSFTSLDACMEKRGYSK